MHRFTCLAMPDVCVRVAIGGRQPVCTGRVQQRRLSLAGQDNSASTPDDTEIGECFQNMQDHPLVTANLGTEYKMRGGYE